MKGIVRWWQRKSIRFQMTTFVFSFILAMSAALLAIVYHVDTHQREKNAFLITQMVSQTLDEYFRDVIRSNNPEDLAEHLAAFPSVDVVEVHDRNGRMVFRYQRPHVDLQEYSEYINSAKEKPIYFNDGEDMVVRHRITEEDGGAVLGDAVYVVDVESLSSQLAENAFYLAVFLPLFLLIGGTLAYWISRFYNAPLEYLSEHMSRLGSEALQPLPLQQVNSSREISTLYRGFNTLIDTVQHMTEMLKRQALEDELTGLLNRRGLRQAYETLADAQPEVDAMFISINIDDFRLINDEEGQGGGDRLLREIAGVLKLVLPDHAVMGRVYGDDFRVLLAPADCAESETLVQSVHEALQRITTAAGNLSVSMGWLCFRPAEWSYDLLHNALESALNCARQDGRGHVCRYNPDAEESRQHGEDLKVLAQIKKALSGENARFELYAQPIVPLAETGSDQLSYEILIRMFDSAGRFLSPDRFLGTAQRYNLMGEIDLWVVGRCVRELSRVPDHLSRLHRVHINLSGSTLHNDHFLEALKEMIIHYDKFPWFKVEFELTETSAVSNFNRARGFIDWCREKGIGFALDDFGTGTASFEYLKLLPFDTVKIDGLFVRNMHDDPMDLAVIKHIREVTRLRGQETVAEFVETAEDVALLKEIGIDYGQGYYFSKPLPLSDIVKQV